MALLQAGVPVHPMGSTCASTTANVRGNHVMAARQIRYATVLIRRSRYHLYRIAGTVVLVAGSWAG